MKFTAYIQRQKNLIRSRHSGETFINAGGETLICNDRERLLAELDNLRGLNKAERVFSATAANRG